MIGQRIKQARLTAGLTQDQTVEALRALGVSLTKGGLSKYERGGSIPKAKTIRGLARVLGVETSFFLDEGTTDVQWLAFRKVSRLGKKRQERIKATAEAQVEVLLTLERALEPRRRRAIPSRSPVVGLEDAERAAEDLRKQWRLGEQPIESVTTAIEDGGGIVVEIRGEDLFDGLCGWANGSIPVIVVSAAVSDDRRRFNLAHELGHLFTEPRVQDSSLEERLAHRFAAAFLVPRGTAFRELGRKRRRLAFGELAMLKKKHGLSMQAWIHRASDLAIIHPSHARRLLAEMSARGWRREEPVRFKGEEEPMRLRQLVIRALAEGLITRTQGERICPGASREVDEPGELKQGTLDARSLMELSTESRERLLQHAAESVKDEYEQGGALTGLESLSEEDHRDVSVDD